MGVASCLERVPLVMDKPDYRVPFAVRAINDDPAVSGDGGLLA